MKFIVEFAGGFLLVRGLYWVIKSLRNRPTSDEDMGIFTRGFFLTCIGISCILLGMYYSDLAKRNICVCFIVGFCVPLLAEGIFKKNDS